MASMDWPGFWIGYAVKQVEPTMDAQDAVDFGREAFSICLTLGAPVLIVGLVVGIIVGVLQAMTHVQDQTVSFVPNCWRSNAVFQTSVGYTPAFDRLATVD